MTEYKFKSYLFHYRHDGADWGIEIVASSPEDARARLKSLSWATYRGEVAATVSVPGPRLDGILGRLSAYCERLYRFARMSGS